MARWLEVLSQFDFKIEFRKGVKHVNADFLSRKPCDPEQCDCYDGITILENLPCKGCSGCQRKHEEWSILADIDDVVPLISKRVRPEATCFLQVEQHCIPLFILLLGYCKLSVQFVFAMFMWLYTAICHHASSVVHSTRQGIQHIGLSEPNWRILHKLNVFGKATGSIRRLRAHGSGDGTPDQHVVDLHTADATTNVGSGGGVTYKFSNWVGSYTCEELSKMQMSDPDIRSILSWRLKSESQPSRDIIASESPAIRNLWLQWSQLSVADGILFRTFVSTDETKSYDQLVLPSVLHKEILRATHSSVMSAHLGVKRTLAKIQLNFYWYNMNQAVKLWIKQCSFCGGRKRPAKKPKAPLQEYYVGYPLDRVVTDITGPFPMSEAGNRYILVIMDSFTKFVEAYAIPDQRAETVANKIVFEFFARYGLALDLHSDQGKNYMSDLFRQMCCLLEINQTKSTTYRAMSNGMVERFNKTLLNMIVTYVNEEQTNWDVYLPLVTAAYRGTEHATTGYTPNQLMFGREVNLPVHFLIGVSPHRNNAENTYTDYVANLNDRMTRIYQIVRQNLKGNSERQKRDYDTRIATHNYSVGDIVYIMDSTKTVGKSPKLKSELYKGPLVVTRKISNLLFEVKSGPKAKCKIVHHDRIKPFNCDTIPQWVLSLQQHLQTGTKPTPIVETTKERRRNIIKQSSSAKETTGIRDSVLRRGTRDRKVPQRLQL
ncbi:MAG: DDE-type integrase/transposase/recombinase [Sedimenticola sp.]